MSFATPARSLHALALLALASGTATAQITTRVSIGSFGHESPLDIYSGRLSADGRYAAVESWGEIHVHDRHAGTTAPATPGPSTTTLERDYLGDISADGRWLVYQRGLVVGGIPYPGFDVWVRDLVTGVDELVSVDPSGTPMGSIFESWSNLRPKISADGSRVLFTSDADGIVPADQNGVQDLFVRDRNLGLTRLVSVDSSGSQGTPICSGPAYQCINFSSFDLSADGGFVAFSSGINDLVPNDVNGEDVFLHDLTTGLTSLVSVNSSGAQADSTCIDVTISDDGRHVAFLSWASNLAAPNPHQGIYVRDLQLGTTVRASVDSNGIAANMPCGFPHLAGNGHSVAFVSTSSNLVPGDTNGNMDVFVHDLQTGLTRRASVDSAGAEVSSPCWVEDLSADGRLALFTSDSDTLVIHDKNDATDLFVHDLGLSGPAFSTYCTPKQNFQGRKPRISAAGTPTLSGATGLFVTATKVVPGRDGILFWGMAPKSTPFKGGTLCVQGPLVRTPVQTATKTPLPGVPGAYPGVYSFRFDAAYLSQHGLPAGQTVYAQYWSLDKSPATVGLTDAIQFTVFP